MKLLNTTTEFEKLILDAGVMPPGEYELRMDYWAQYLWGVQGVVVRFSTLNQSEE